MKVEIVRESQPPIKEVVLRLTVDEAKVLYEIAGLECTIQCAIENLVTATAHAQSAALLRRVWFGMRNGGLWLNESPKTEQL